MKNLLTSMLIVFGFGFTYAQRLPPKPPKPPIPHFLKKKKGKKAKKARPTPPKPGDRPYILTPDGKKIYPGQTPPRPQRPPHPPFPPKPPIR